MKKTKPGSSWNEQDTLFKQTFAKITDEDIWMNNSRKEEILCKILVSLYNTCDK